MRTLDTKVAVGIMTDEEAMFELLTKFLGKEGYETRRVSTNASEVIDLPLVILAPTRDPSRSRSWFANLKKRKPAVLVVQCCDEDYADVDSNVVMLMERPLNLKQLSETIRKTLEKSGSLVSPAK
jgi:DNA-binding response OmpR family regulator